MPKGAIMFAIGGLLAIGAPAAALANDNIELDEDSHLEQVIPPATLHQGSFQMVQDPLDVSSIVITDKTPADEFVSATTPLVVALMLGSVGLVIYTLTRADRQD